MYKDSDFEIALRVRLSQKNQLALLWIKRPLFVLDMPCYCDETKSETTDHYDDVLDENDENDNLDDNIEALFNGVSDDDSDLDFNEDVGSRRSRSSGKRSIRVQSAPTVINEKRPFSAAPHVFKKTEIKPFKMSLRWIIFFYYNKD